MLSSCKIATKWYPFGMLAQNYNAKSYRFGFNGKEMDNTIKGLGNSYNFGARIYDSRLGRWCSPDPLEAKYPNISTYVFVVNNPVIAIDPDGKDVDLGNLYERNEKGHLKHKLQVFAFELFASSKVGKKYLKERAQKGFELKAVFIKKASFQVEKQGCLSDKVDVNFKVGDLSEKAKGIGADGLTETYIKNGKLSLTFTLDKNQGTLKKTLKSPQNAFVILNSTNTIFHEVFIHGFFKEKNYFSGKYKGLIGKISPNGKYEHSHIHLTNYRTITYQWLRVVNYSLNLGQTDEEIWKKFID